MNQKSSLVFLILAVVCLFLGGLVSSLRIASAKAEKPYPFEHLLTSDNEGNVRAVDVILDVKQFIKDHGDTTRILRTVDTDAHVVIYFTLNATGDMVTSMHPVPFATLDRHSDLWKRYKPY